MRDHLRVVFGLALLATAVAQSTIRESGPTFHVKGTIDSVTNGALPRIEVTFQGETATRTTLVNDKGFYEIDLPVGVYTMTAVFPALNGQRTSLMTKYVRFFQVKSPSMTTLNGVLYGPYSCDGVWGGNTPEEREELYKDDCGGVDSFAVPTKDGVPLHLDISYGRRQRKAATYLYSSEAVQRIPIFVTYNLFSLRAGSVEYDSDKKTIRATGDVLIEDQSGETRRASAAFKMTAGMAIPIQ